LALFSAALFHEARFDGGARPEAVHRVAVAQLAHRGGVEAVGHGEAFVARGIHRRK
jgi:hypothetical protein